MDTALGFEVASVKALQKHKGDEQGQNEIHNGGGFVSKAVIQRPVGCQGMKQIIFNLPPAVADLPKKATGEPGRR